LAARASAPSVQTPASIWKRLQPTSGQLRQGRIKNDLYFLKLLVYNLSHTAGRRRSIQPGLFPFSFGPHRLVIHPSGQFLFVSDSNNQRVRRIDLATGAVTTVAGSNRGYADGVGVTALFDDPRALAMGNGDLLYVVDRFNQRIRAITLSTGVVPQYTAEVDLISLISLQAFRREEIHST
jgi:DNA-binding beta-propeller fold protein YncE